MGVGVATPTPRSQCCSEHSQNQNRKLRDIATDIVVIVD